MDEAGEIVAAPGIFYQIVFLNPNRLDVFKITFLRLSNKHDNGCITQSESTNKTLWTPQKGSWSGWSVFYIYKRNERFILNIYWKHNSDEEDDDELGSSESDSLSENINVETNDFVSEIQTSTSRESRSALLIFYYLVL